jgi:hypothetical protein
MSSTSTVPTAADLTVEIDTLKTERARSRGARKGALTTRIKKLEIQRDELGAIDTPPDAAPTPSPATSAPKAKPTRARSERRNPYVAVSDAESSEPAGRRFIRHVTFVERRGAVVLVTDSKGRELLADVSEFDAARALAGLGDADTQA